MGIDFSIENVTVASITDLMEVVKQRGLTCLAGHQIP